MATNHYIRAGATGAADGTDWDDAYTDLPATLTRGDTYYVADGNYSSYTFDDAVSGTDLITIKKATIGDHGTQAGWSNAYGDGQAVFDSSISFTTDDWVFDGQVRDSSDWSDSTAYGFYIDGGPGGNNDTLITVTSTDNVTIYYTWAQFDAAFVGQPDEPAYRSRGIYALTSLTNFTFEYSAIKNISQFAAFLYNSSTGPASLRYNWFENIYRKEIVSSGSAGNGSDNLTFAFNKCKNIAGTGALVMDSADSWGIYGNWFWSPDSNYSYTDVVIGTWTGDHPDRSETNTNILIYNNTFYVTNSNKPIDIQFGTGNECRNNLMVGETISITGAITASSNTQNAATSVVNDANNGDFTLSAATADGTDLSSPYDVDLLGNTRGNDGVWDRGAYEYVETPSGVVLALA